MILSDGLDLAGFERALIVTAVLLVAGGIVSLIGIRNTRVSTHSTHPAPASPASAMPATREDRP